MGALFSAIFMTTDLSMAIVCINKNRTDHQMGNYSDYVRFQKRYWMRRCILLKFFFFVLGKRRALYWQTDARFALEWRLLWEDSHPNSDWMDVRQTRQFETRYVSQYYRIFFSSVSYDYIEGYLGLPRWAWDLCSLQSCWNSLECLISSLFESYKAYYL